MTEPVNRSAFQKPSPCSGNSSAPGGTSFVEALRRRLAPSESSFLFLCDFETFRRQESTLILLNLTILALLILLQVLYLPVAGVPSRLVLVLFAGRFVEQTLEFFWLQGRTRPFSRSVTAWYARLSVWAHVMFAFLIVVVSPTGGSQFWVLIALPVIAAAFRFSLAGALFVVLVGGGLDFLHVWLDHTGDPYTRALAAFETSVFLLLLFVIAVVVWLMASYIRGEELRLRESLSALETAQRELVAKEKMAAIGRLAGAIAHEIRNPVGMIVSSVAMVKQKGAMDVEQQRQICDILFTESERLERLSGDFLAYARVREPERKPTCVRTTLEYVAGLARARAEERGISVRIELPEPVEGSFDPFQVHQALLNLVVNALDAAPARGEVVLRGGKENSGGVRFEVENPVAQPIPDAVREQLFEPFFTTKGGGTGLGLSIARSIARAHKGDVELVRNEADRVVFALTLGGGRDPAA